MWARHGFYSGMGYETAFSYDSTTHTWWQGFFYLGDNLRPYTNTFYHLSYLIGRILGIDGSYVPFQVVYAALWWARGLLVFLIVRRFFPGSILLAYVSGALVLVHAADGALQWVGQMNQFGFIFWMLLAFYFLTRAYQSENAVLAIILTLAACCFEKMSIFSYESQFFLVLLFPVTLLAFGRRWRWLALISFAWYLEPARYIYMSLDKYRHSGGGTYQEAVMRKNWSVSGLLGDWGFNIGASLEFWKWPSLTGGVPLLPSLAAAVLVAAGGAALLLVHRKDVRHRAANGTTRAWLCLLAAGIVAVVLSFPVYLMLGSARGLWRTQLLSGVGAGLVLTAVCGLLAHRLPWLAARAGILLVAAGVVVCFGSIRAIQLGATHRGIWERHRKAITEVLQVAPNVKPDTVVVLTNVPKGDDPFGDDYWYDMAIRLIYPHIRVVGLYYYADGSRAPGDPLTMAGDRWTWDHRTGLPLLDSASLANTVVIRYDPSGNGSLEPVLPAFLCPNGCAAGPYHPSAVITGPIDPTAARRYRLGAP